MKDLPTTIYRIPRGIRPAPIACACEKYTSHRKTNCYKPPRQNYWADPISNLGFSLITGGSYEPLMESTLLKFLKPGGVFIDVGANEGYFTIHAACAMGPQGRVIAVEPQDRLIPVIRRNLTLNELNNVTLVHGAVSDNYNATLLHCSPETNTVSSSFYKSNRYPVPT